MMRRLLPIRLSFFVLFLFAALSVFGQGPGGETKEEAANPETDMIWKVANFAIFAAGIGYVIARYAPAFFNSRSADIQRAIEEATGLKMNADLRYSEMDRKMGNLAAEASKIRAEAQREMESERSRLTAQTNEETAAIQRNATAEIEALRGEGANQLRAYTAQQALAAAEARLRARFAATGQKDLIDDFVRLVERGEN